MLGNKPEYYDKIAYDLMMFFYDQYYKPILEAVREPTLLDNAVPTMPVFALSDAIKSGKVRYQDGVFTGEFNARISRELSRFATFNSRTKKWSGKPPFEVKAASILAETKRKDMESRLKKAIEKSEANINRAIQNLSVSQNLPLSAMTSDIKSDFASIGVTPDIDERLEKKLRADYNDSQRLNVKNWNDEQISRLREMVTKYQTTGTNESLLDLIEREYEVSANKARFLARQETGLFFEALSRNRAKSAGVRRYKWSTSQDERVRKNPRGPNHKHLHGEIFDLDGPGGIVDLKTGRRAHAGQDFLCRCQKIWILE